MKNKSSNQIINALVLVLYKNKSNSENWDFPTIAFSVLRLPGILQQLFQIYLFYFICQQVGQKFFSYNYFWHHLAHQLFKSQVWPTSIFSKQYQYNIKRKGCEDSLKWSPKGKCFHVLSNSFNCFLKLMYGDQSEELVSRCLGLKGEGHLKI